MKAVQREKENRLLARKLDMEQNKGKTLEKPDDPIKEIATIAERDNATDLLAASRFCLRPEVVEPSAYWDRVQYKWPEVHRFENRVLLSKKLWSLQGLRQTQLPQGRGWLNRYNGK